MFCRYSSDALDRKQLEMSIERTNLNLTVDRRCSAQCVWTCGLRGSEWASIYWLLFLWQTFTDGSFFHHKVASRMWQMVQKCCFKVREGLLIETYDAGRRRFSAIPEIAAVLATLEFSLVMRGFQYTARQLTFWYNTANMKDRDPVARGMEGEEEEKREGAERCIIVPEVSMKWNISWVW